MVFFKYANFFISITNAASGMLGGQVIGFMNVILPIGISFFTFTQITYLVDSFHGKVRERNFIHYLLFASFFPHLLAGPVLHHAQMMPQFAKKETYNIQDNRVAQGIILFILGLSKKMLLANPLGEYADGFFQIVSSGGSPGFLQSWVGVLAYTFQIYFDFSGYSDMAVGLALFFGILLPFNFNSPYQSVSIIDFWRRWHISLSTFLRDYLYIPLGGNKQGKFRRYRNLLLTMLLGGLWHGAGWTFVLWGGAHGLLLMVNHAWRYWRGEVSESPIFRYLYWVITFVSICLTWVIFRSASTGQALTIYKGMLGLHGGGASLFDGIRLTYPAVWLSLYLSAAFAICLLCKPSQTLIENNPLYAGWSGHPGFRRGFVPVLLLLFIASLDNIGRHSPFLYFQF